MSQQGQQQQTDSLRGKVSEAIERLRRLQTSQAEEMGKAIEETAKTMMEAEYSRKCDEQKDKALLGHLKQVLKQMLDDFQRIDKIYDEPAELTAEEMNKAWDEIGIKLVQTGHYDEEKTEEDKEPQEKLKQYLEQKLEAMQLSHLRKGKTEFSKELAELVSGKSKEEEDKAIEKMAKKVVELKHSREFDEEQDEEEYGRAKQELKEDLDGMQRMRATFDELAEDFGMLVGMLVGMLASNKISEETMDKVFEEMAKKLVGATNSREFDKEKEEDKELCGKLKQELKQTLGGMQRKKGASGQPKIETSKSAL